MTGTGAPVTPTTLRRSVSNTLKGSAGNLVEWFDVYVYSVFATYFEKQFFDANDKNSTIYVWATFAVTFLMRPIGSWWFGRYADRFGRRASLTLSVSIMAGGSFVIALTPTESAIGVASAVILVLCRLVQGFATGGEYGTSATYMSEAAVPGKRGFLSSFQPQLVIHSGLANSIIYVTVLIGLSLLTYIFFLRNRAPNWLEDPDVMAARRDERSPASAGR